MADYCTVWTELEVPRKFAEQHDFNAVEIFKNFEDGKTGIRKWTNDMAYGHHACFGAQYFMKLNPIKKDHVVIRAQRITLRTGNSYAKRPELDFPNMSTCSKESWGKGKPVISDEDFDLVLKLLEETLPVQIYRHETDPRQVIVFHNSDDIGNKHFSSLWLQTAVRHITETADVLVNFVAHAKSVIEKGNKPDFISSYIYSACRHGTGEYNHKYGDHSGHFNHGHSLFRFKHEADEYVKSYNPSYPITRTEISNYLKWWSAEGSGHLPLKLFGERTTVHGNGVQSLTSVLMHHLVRNRKAFNQVFGE